MSSAKWRQFCLGFNVLIKRQWVGMQTPSALRWCPKQPGSTHAISRNVIPHMYICGNIRYKFPLYLNIYQLKFFNDNEKIYFYFYFHFSIVLVVFNTRVVGLSSHQPEWSCCVKHWCVMSVFMSKHVFGLWNPIKVNSHVSLISLIFISRYFVYNRCERVCCVGRCYKHKAIKMTLYFRTIDVAITF